MRFDIITMGSAVIDAFLETELSEHKGAMNLPIGSKILVDELYFATGGGGTNTAAAFSKLGLKTGYLGEVGNDENGDIILEELEKLGVEFLGVLGSEPTGYSVIIDSKKHNRTVLTYKGINANLTIDEINFEKLKSDWFYFSTMTGESLKTQEKVIEWAHKKGKHIVYNPSSYVTKKGANYLKNILKYTDILILNLEEAMHIVKNGNIYKSLHEFGPKIVCVTNGKKGSSASDGIKVYKVEARKVKAVEVTGAGDAYASGFVFGFMKFGHIVEAMRAGTLNAESVIKIPGAKNGLLTYKEIMLKLAHEKIKINMKKL